MELCNALATAGYAAATQQEVPCNAVAKEYTCSVPLQLLQPLVATMVLFYMKLTPTGATAQCSSCRAYSQHTTTGTPTCSSHNGSVLYETYEAGHWNLHVFAHVH